MLASASGQRGPGRERADLVHRRTARLRCNASTPWFWPAVTERNRRATTKASCRGSRPWRPAAVGWRRCARVRSWPPRPVCSTDGASPPIGPGPSSWPRSSPALDVDADPIYVRDGKFWTSAGVTAGIDLALALVQDDLGVDVAQTVARQLVMFLHRPGGQTQFASPVWVPRAERSTVRAVQNLVEAAPGGDHRLPTLAAAAAMSVRHFARVFARRGGRDARAASWSGCGWKRPGASSRPPTTPSTWWRPRCGFGTAETLRRVFQRRLSVAPDFYRRRFRVVASERTSA